MGGLALLVIRRPPSVGSTVYSGSRRRVMLAATAFSLLVPALGRGENWEVLVGFGLGCGVLYGLDRAVPHVHARLPSRGTRSIQGAAGLCYS